MNNDLKIRKINEQIEMLRAEMNDPNLCQGTASTLARISGYYRPVENYNIGKTQEFVERKTFKVA